MQNDSPHFSYRVHVTILMLILIPIGLATKKGDSSLIWINHYAGGIIYEIFWCLFISFINPRLNGWKIAAWVLFITCCLESLQLWHPLFLEHIRRTFLGRALLGTSFSWWDFPHYILGSSMGGLIIEKLKKKCIK